MQKVIDLTIDNTHLLLSRQPIWQSTLWFILCNHFLTSSYTRGVPSLFPGCQETPSKGEGLIKEGWSALNCAPTKTRAEPSQLVSDLSESISHSHYHSYHCLPANHMHSTSIWAEYHIIVGMVTNIHHVLCMRI